MTAPLGFLSTCEREPLHLSGEIQPHGGMVVLDSERRVTHVSENIGRFLPSATPESVLDDERWDAAGALELDSLGPNPGDQHRYRSPVTTDGAEDAAGVWLDWVLSRGVEGQIIVEVSPRRKRSQPKRLVEQDEVDSMLCLRRLSAVLDYERYMFYEFRRDGDGEVSAELCLSDDIGTYEGLRFPASDIPQIARHLYKKNPFRLIPDARAPSVPLRSKQSSPPDLTHSDLRSVSPAHRAYMSNMGIVSSLSVPVIVDEDLVGLISAHSRQPVLPSADELSEVVTTVKRFLHAQSSKHAQKLLQSIDRAEWWFRSVLSGIDERRLPALFPSLTSALENELGLDGVVLFIDGEAQRSSSVPESDVPALLSVARRQKQLLTTVESFRYSKDRPPEEETRGDWDVSLDPAKTSFAGAMFLQLLRSGRTVHLVLLRREHPYEVAWGGNPNKPEESPSPELPVSPRTSFEKWVELRSGYCRPWERSTLLMAHSIRHALQKLEW